MTMDPDPIESTPDEDLAPGSPAETTPAPLVEAVTVSTGVVGKTRNPWGVWGLSIITLGIYQLYWYYKVNAEVRDYDPSIEVQPGISLLSQFIPIANLVSMVKTAGRISRAQTTAGRPERCSGLVGFLLIFVLGTWLVYYQSQLNKVWDEYGNPTEGTPV